MGLVAVNGFDAADVINKYVADKKFTFQVGMADKKEGGATYDVGMRYGVSAYPTNYVVDASTGKVIWRGIGFNESAIRKALGDAGVK